MPLTMKLDRRSSKYCGLLVVAASVLLIVWICSTTSGLYTWRCDGTKHSEWDNESTMLHRRLIPSHTSFISKSVRAVRGLQSVSPYNVTLILSLSYLNESTSIPLEDRDEFDPVVLDFCRAVNAQASGAQVMYSANAIGVEVDTYVDNSTSSTGSTELYQCTILDTNRATDNVSTQLWGQDYFILEVQVRQTVWVTVPSGGSSLSNWQVSLLVVNGFNVGEGGRVSFRNLLRRSSAYATVLSADALDKFSSPSQTLAPTTPPTQAASTEAPTSAPTSVSSPTVAPSSFFPTSAPPTIPASELPTVAPSTASPAPSDAPTAVPTQTRSTSPSSRSIQPTVQPTSMSPTQKSSTPTVESHEEGGASSSSGSDSRLPLIFGAMAGGAAAILASCFFIFCVWFPICRPKPRSGQGDCSGEENGDGEYDDDDERAIGTKRCHPPSLTSSVVLRRPIANEPLAASVIPTEVQLDHENESLADTTLGDLTAGGELLRRAQLQQLQQQPTTQTRQPSELQRGKPPKPKTVPRVLPKVDLTMMSGSFDESSIYTTDVDVNAIEAVIAPKLAPGKVARNSTHRLPPSASKSRHEASEKVVSSPTKPPPRSPENRKGNAGLLPFPSPRGPRKLGSVSSDTSRLSFVGAENIEASDEVRALNVAKSMDAGTKGFDPFQEDDFSDSSALHFDDNDQPDRDFRKREIYSAEELDERSSPSQSSNRTDKIRNRPMETPRDGERLLGPMEGEEKREVDDESLETPSSSAFTGFGRASNNLTMDSDPMDQVENNTLLRSVLEDARRLSQKRGMASRSKQSRQSAPSRLSEPRTPKKASSPFDLLADHQDLDAFFSSKSPRRAMTSANTVGASVYREPRRVTPDQWGERVGEVPVTFSSKSSRRELEAGGSSRAFAHATVRTKDPNLLLASNPMDARNTASEPRRTSLPARSAGTLGADPKERTIPPRDVPDTPMSSPGVLGIAVKPKGKGLPDDASTDSEGLSNPWLYDAIEQTLGPRSPAADMESISGRSSRSERSFRSSRSGKSSRSQHSHDKGKSRHSRKVGARRKASSSSTGSTRTPPSYRSKASTARATINVSSGEFKDASDAGLTPRTLEYDLQRLEVHIADGSLQVDSDQLTTSTITASTAGASRSTLSSVRMPTRRSKTRRVVVVVPPGKLGVVLSDRKDGTGTVVSEVRPSSALAGMLSPGDKLIAIDGEDVRGMYMSQVTSLMASKVGQERRLTILTSSEFEDLPEAKDEDSVE